MPRIINLTALQVDTITVNVQHPDGTQQSFDLKDDIPVDIGIAVIHLFSKIQVAGDDLAARLQVVDADTLHVVGDIFRHSYPETTDGEIGSLITPKDRMELINVFFTSLMSRYNVRGNATDASTTTTEPTEAVATPAETSQPDTSPVETPLPSDSSSSSAA